MRILGDLALGFLVESAVLVSLWAALGTAAALIVSIPARPAFTALKRPLIAGTLTAMTAGSLAARFGAPEPWWLAVGRREVPMVWSIAGALVGAAAAIFAARRRPSAAGEPAG